jgi:general secretion pathway protein G
MVRRMPNDTRRRLGFTLIELMVVMAIVATLLSIVSPRYMLSIEKAKEAALRTNLRMTREAIDKYKADTGTYPSNLQSLVDARYLRELPFDPVQENDNTWSLLPPPDRLGNGVYDIKSSADGTSVDGIPYSKM